MSERLSAWALARPRLFCVAGPRGRFASRALESIAVEAADSPRDADILVVAGDVPDAMLGALRRSYAAMPTPRAVMRLGDDTPGHLPYAAVVGEPWTNERVEDGLGMARRALFGVQVPLEADDAEAGGGMDDMPAGRPMAETGPDPDDLWLDRLPTHLGPLHPALPSGLEMRVVLQGDRVVEANVVSGAWAREHGTASRTDLGPDAMAFAEMLLGDAPRIEVLESARAASHLRWAAGVARVCGLDGPAFKLLETARVAASGAHAQARLRVDPLVAACERFGVLRRRLRGTAVLDADAAAAVGGPVGRACGLPRDLRSEDPAYGRLGFEPVVADGSDAWARWWVRTREARASLELAGRARGVVAERTDAVEGPRGPLRLDEGRWSTTPSARAIGLLPDVATGCEWAELVDAIMSLDIDPDEAGA